MKFPVPALKVVPTGHRSHSNAMRRRTDFFKKQKGKCFYCKGRMVKSQGYPNSCTLEHRKALSKGGNHSRKNLVATCHTCNRMKRSMDEGDFLDLLSKIAAHRREYP